MNEWDQVRDAVAAARRLDSALNQYANAMAETMIGRLRSVNSTSTLAKLKRELRDFNIHTGRWSD